MQSRNEDILQAMIDGTEASTLPPPQSRNEALLLQVLDKMNGLDPSGDAEKAAESAEEAAASAQQAAVSATQAQAAAAIASAYAPSDTLPAADVVSCDYGVEGNMSSVIAEINPIQDLHGYSNPWPAGGGKNLIDNSASAWEDNGINSSGQNAVASEQKRTIGYYSIPSGTVSICISGITAPSTTSDVRIFFYDSNKTFVEYKNYSSKWTLASDVAYFRLRAPKTLDISGLQIESGETATTYSPYSNICPISCYDSISVTRKSANLCPLPSHWPNNTTTSNYVTFTVQDDGGIKVQGTAGSSNAIGGLVQSAFPLDRGKYVCFLAESDSGVKLQLRRNSSGGAEQFSTSNSGTTTTSAATFAETINIWARLVVEAGTTVDTVVYPMILASEETPTMADFIPYKADTFTTAIPTPPGTVYGGTLDMVSGVLVVDRAMVTFDGSDNTGWQRIAAYGTSTRFDYRGQRDTVKPKGSVLCNMLPKGTIGTQNTECINVHASVGDIQIQIATGRLSADTVAGLMEYLAGHTLQVVYELAAPITYQLTPVEVTALTGTNVLQANSGKVSVTLPIDIKKYIDEKIAQLQALILDN